MSTGRPHGALSPLARCFRSGTVLWALTPLAALVLLPGCQDSGAGPASAMSPEDGPEPEQESESDPQEPGSVAPQCEQLGSAALRRLTQQQYENAVRDVLGVDLDLSRALPSDARVGAFASNAEATVTTFHIDKYMVAAEQVAGEAITQLDEWSDCNPATEGDDECARRFIEQIGGRLFRRPVADEELASLQEVYAVGRQGEGYGGGIQLVLEAMLQMPEFLYLIEQGYDSEVEGRRVLTPHELAARLSFMLWNTTPDDELLDAAASGALATPEGLLAQAERLLDSPRATEAIASFHTQWLGLEGLETTAKDPERYPGFSEDMLAGMLQETVDFADYVVREAGGSYTTLMTAPYSFVDPAVAPIYGLSPSVDPAVPTVLDVNRRGGVLLQASVLTQHARYNKTSPVLRGVFVRRNVLCQHLGSPPAGLDTSLEEPEFGADPVTTAEMLEAHRANPACAACHDRIDPVGVVFEHYGAMGEYRETEDGLTISSPDPLVGTDVDGPIVDARDLVERLAQSSEAHACYATQVFRFSTGRNDTRDDECALEHLTQRFEQTGGNIRDLLLSIVMSETFRYRHEPVQEEA